MCDTCVVSRESQVSNTKALGFNTPPERGATQSLNALSCSRLFYLQVWTHGPIHFKIINSAGVPPGSPPVSNCPG
eukprot:5677091-Amphidinium_carterae.1